MVTLEELDFDFNNSVKDMVLEFGGYQDSKAVCNLIVGGITVQVVLSIVANSEELFNKFKGVEYVKIK